MIIYAVVAIAAYLLGSIPFGYLLLRVFRGTDVRSTGSGNIGATNVARSAPGLGALTLILDAAKGFGAVLGAMALASSGLLGSAAPAMAAATAAVFAILGHVFPVWLKFKGGKGVATGVGSFLALAPKAVLVVLVIFAAVVMTFRYISLGSIVAAAAFPLVAWLLHGDQTSTPAVMAAIVGAAALIILKHHQNIRRLLAGTEHRFSLKRS
jgi:glycerol-3-phosphate acyltransferase PlsY